MKFRFSNDTEHSHTRMATEHTSEVPIVTRTCDLTGTTSTISVGLFEFWVFLLLFSFSYRRCSGAVGGVKERETL